MPSVEAYLDIETTGLSRELARITGVGIWCPGFFASETQFW